MIFGLRLIKGIIIQASYLLESEVNETEAIEISIRKVLIPMIS